MTKLEIAAYLATAVLSGVRVARLCIIVFNEVARVVWPEEVRSPTSVGRASPPGEIGSAQQKAVETDVLCQGGQRNEPQTAKPFELYQRQPQIQAALDHEVQAHRCAGWTDARLQVRGHSIGGSNLSNAIKLASLCFAQDAGAADDLTDRLIVLSDMDINEVS